MWLFSLMVEATFGSIVFCAVTGDVNKSPLAERILRSILWPATLTNWLTQRNGSRLEHVGRIIWLFVTLGWLLSLVSDRLHAPMLAVAWVILAFIVLCVDGMSLALFHKPVRAFLRALLWPVALYQYLRDHDTVRMNQTIVIVWLFLTGSWLITWQWDRFGPTLQGRVQ